jgi:hypothetical protein
VSKRNVAKFLLVLIPLEVKLWASPLGMEKSLEELL